MPRQTKVYEETETIQEILQYPCLAIEDRCLREDTCREFGIRTALSAQDGVTHVAHYFPHYDKKKKLTGFAKRDLTKPKKDQFSAIGSVTVDSLLFAQQDLRNGGKKLIITEGHYDAPSAYQILVDSVKGTKWEGKIVPNVVSIPLGTANAVEAIAHNQDFVKSFDEVVLLFDNDEATPKESLKGVMKGKEATEAVAGFLLTDNLFIIDYPKGINDPNEALVEGQSYELAKRIQFGLKKYSPDKLVSGEDILVEDLMRPLEKGIMIDRYPKLMSKIQGFRKSELTLFCAFSGVGKSTLAREISYEMLSVDEKVGFIFLEEPSIKTQQSIIALDLGIPLKKYRENPSAVTTPEAVAAAKDRLLGNGKAIFMDHFGSLQVDRLMTLVNQMFYLHNVDYVFLDHVNIVVSGLEGSNERKDIDHLMTELAAFVSCHNMGIGAVAHLKRVDDNPKKDKDGDVIYPYWRKVKKEMLRGTAGLEQLSFNIIALEDEVLENGERGRVRSSVLKNREWDYLGLCDTMNMDHTGRLQVVDDSMDNNYQNTF